MLSEGYVYLNDITNQQTIIRLADREDSLIYSNWVRENHPEIEVQDSELKIGLKTDAEACLNYFGFTLETFLDSLFDLLPAKSSSAENNRLLIQMILKHPDLPKSKCCIIAGKNPTHYNRLAQTIADNCEKASKISGGRSALTIIKSVRADF